MYRYLYVCGDISSRAHLMMLAVCRPCTVELQGQHSILLRVCVLGCFGRGDDVAAILSSNQHASWCSGYHGRVLLPSSERTPTLRVPAQRTVCPRGVVLGQPCWLQIQGRVKHSEDRAVRNLSCLRGCTLRAIRLPLRAMLTRPTTALPNWPSEGQQIVCLQACQLVCLKTHPVLGTALCTLIPHPCCGPID